MNPNDATPCAGSPVIQIRAPSCPSNGGGGARTRVRAPSAVMIYNADPSVFSVPSMADAPSTVLMKNLVASSAFPVGVPPTAMSAPATCPISLAKGPVTSLRLPPPGGATITRRSRSVPTTDTMPRTESAAGCGAGRPSVVPDVLRPATAPVAVVPGPFADDAPASREVAPAFEVACGRDAFAPGGESATAGGPAMINVSRITAPFFSLLSRHATNPTTQSTAYSFI